MRARSDASSPLDPSGDATHRDESEPQRVDRNWTELLQELRVTQTGVQLLTGFLLTLPFQERFTKLSSASRYVYLATVGCSIASTIALVAPVGAHRLLFRRHARRSIVAFAHGSALAGLLLLGLAICGVAYVVTVLLTNVTAASVAAGSAAALALALWIVVPLAMRSRE